MILVGVLTTPEVPGDGGTPGEPQPSRHVPLTWTLTAPWLERTWTLTDLASPVVKLRGAMGIGKAVPVHRWSESPVLDGSTWEGVRVERGEVFVPVMVQAADSQAFGAEHSAFMSALDRRREATLRLSRPNGSWRELAVRYAGGADSSIDLDPMASCLARYGVTWVAPDPFWRGEPVSAYFPYVTTPALFPGPPWVLAPNRTLSNATIVNPGDEDSYPTWRVDGPFTSFTVGIGAAVVSLTRTLTAGQWIDVDMTPGVLTIRDHNGVDRWDDVTAVEFAPIPPGTSSLVTSVVGSGAGSGVTLTFTPRYSTAW